MKKVSIQEHAFVELIEMCCKILSNTVVIRLNPRARA